MLDITSPFSFLVSVRLPSPPPYDEYAFALKPVSCILNLNDGVHIQRTQQLTNNRNILVLFF